ncbi:MULTISPECIES: ferrochelatase [Sphingomonas]|uniref:Ferrochelatase n=2 Tax=Sphingomonas TaxID=13687 RepID=A0A2T4YUV2_9SPHN|nr:MULTISPECIES: ferrochelatase [Sphingomonas]MBD8698760.1 ferrochelatase [Sphingomonas sp. CFBP 13714]MDY1009352.1 ferrochelatase [Sphingomonas sp. CFBP9019]PTM47590.1 ferrochelatase [Sphingomonas aerolata]
MTLPPDHPAIPKPRIGVLLMNLGTPDGPDVRSVKRYLGEFLSDRRVVEIPAIAWQPILRGIILNTRPKKSAHAYSQVWREDGSPLAAITRLQAAAVKDSFGPEVMVDWAMRYGRPAIAERLSAMQAAGCERILLAPLYPQYCAATTATANDKAFAHLAGLRWQPALRTLPPYYDDPLYIDALKTDLETSLAALDFVPDAIVASFHGMPKRTLEMGDPYHCHCQKTARLLSAAMGRELTVAFQSRFGPQKWLGPATDETLVELAKAGKTKVAIFAPGFSADCLETLEELSIRGRESFEEAGGKDFAYLPCLNDGPAGIAMLERLLARELEGWTRRG